MRFKNNREEIDFYKQHIEEILFWLEREESFKRYFKTVLRNMLRSELPNLLEDIEKDFQERKLRLEKKRLYK